MWRNACVLLFFLVFLALGLQAQAQEAAPVELFGGYALLSAGPDDFPRRTSHGFQTSLTANLNRWFGVVGDFGMQFDTTRDVGQGFAGRVAKTSVQEYLVGPRFTARQGGVGVFGHFLVGMARGDAGSDFEGFSDSGLMLGGGGGIDVDIAPQVAVRAQFERLGAFVDIAEVTSRFAVGLVVRLGGSR